MSALFDVCVPADQTEGTKSAVARWLKQIGDAVALNEPLLELETDKVLVEVPSPASGTLREILKSVGQETTPLELLGRIDVSAATASAAAAAMAAESPTATPADKKPVAMTAGTQYAATRLSPSVRRLLAELRLQPQDIRGSGAGGRITAIDVRQHAQQRQTSVTASPSSSPSPSPWPSPPTPASQEPSAADADEIGIQRVPLTPMRRRIAEHMVESLLHTAPHVTSVFELDLGAVLAHRARHKDEFAAQGAPLTLTAYFALACIDGIRAVPEVNSRWTDTAIEIYRSIHLGIGTAIEGRGLIVPVLRDLQALNLFGIARQLADLTQRARAGSLQPGDTRGGTFTISNHGTSGSLLAAPIVINQPQAAILGVGRMEKRVVAIERDGQDCIAIRPRCYVTLTIDHRVMDGDRANRFLGVFVDRLASFSAS